MSKQLDLRKIDAPAGADSRQGADDWAAGAGLREVSDLAYDFCRVRAEAVRAQSEISRLRTEIDVLAQAAQEAAARSEAAEERVRVLEEELETERIRLAGCGVAAMANTTETIAQRITLENPYYSASYADVCNAVDREMNLRERVQVLEGAISFAQKNCHLSTHELVSQLNALTGGKEEG